MPEIDLLIVGDALDGPTDQVVEIPSLDYALELFGGYHYESFPLTSGSTGTIVSVVPWGDEVVPFRPDSDGVLVHQSLFEFKVNGTQLSWSRPGDAFGQDPDTFTPTYSGEVVFRILRIPGPTSVLKGIFAVWDTGARVHALRIGGGKVAEASSGSAVFRARYPGSAYNGTTVTVSGGWVTVEPTTGKGRRVSYQPGSDFELRQLLFEDFLRGRQPVLLSGVDSRDQLTVPSGTYVLSGGTDGQLTPDTLRALLEEFDLDGVDVLVPVGLRSTEISGVVSAAVDSTRYPTLIVCQAPPSGALLSGTPNTLRNICAVAFDVTYDLGTKRERRDDAAPLVGSIISRNRFGISLSPVGHPVSPRYNRDELHAITSGGYTVAYNSIRNGWAIWRAVTGDPTWPISTFRAFQEIVRPVYNLLTPYLGNTVTSFSSLNQSIDRVLSDATGGEVVDWSLQVIGDEIFLNIDFVPHGEIRTISAQVSLGLRQAVV